MNILKNSFVFTDKCKSQIEVIKNVLIENQYSSAKDLSEVCGISISQVYMHIKKMRILGIGVLTTNKGYILSSFASKRDDVNFLRKLYGRRTSDYFSLHAAQHDIRNRWKNDSKNLSLIFQPLSVNLLKTDSFVALSKLNHQS